jgi:hypothetical protein
VSGHLVEVRRQESNGDRERRIVRAGARFTQCATNVVLMGERIEDSRAGGTFDVALTEPGRRQVDRLRSQVEQLIDGCCRRRDQPALQHYYFSGPARTAPSQPTPRNT